MTRYLTLIAVLLTAAVLAVQWTSQASAQTNFVTFVSSSGSDGNNCATPATACRFFSGALSKTFDGGNVQCVDAGNFGLFTITISVTIDCLVGGGGINTQFFTINAPGKTVILRNIAVNGFNILGPIDIQAAASVYIENAVVGSGTTAISDRRAGPAKLVISNSSIVNNPGVGILVAPASGVIGVELDHVRSAYNTYGLAVASGGRVMIKNSVFTGNSIAGIQADGGATVSVSATEVSYNSTGIGANGTVMLSNANITSNSLAINGPTQSLGNNLIFANSVDGTTPTIIAAR